MLLLTYLVVVVYILIGFAEASDYQRNQGPDGYKSKIDAIIFYFSDGFETFLIVLFWLPILFWNLFLAGAIFLFRVIKKLAKKLRKIFKRKTTANTTTG